MTTRDEQAAVDCYRPDGLPSREFVARVVGAARGYVQAADVAVRFGVDCAEVARLPAVKVGADGAVMVPRLVVLLAEVFGFPGVAPILAAGLVSGMPRDGLPGLPLPSLAEIACVAGRVRGEMKHREFARRLGADTPMVTAQYERGGLPGARRISPGVVMLPRRLLRLAIAYGLPQVERMANAGLL